MWQHTVHCVHLWRSLFKDVEDNTALRWSGMISPIISPHHARYPGVSNKRSLKSDRSLLAIDYATYGHRRFFFFFFPPLLLAGRGPEVSPGTYCRCIFFVSARVTVLFRPFVLLARCHSPPSKVNLLKGEIYALQSAAILCAWIKQKGVQGISSAWR